MIIDKLRRAFFSVTVKIGIAAFFMLLAFGLTSQPWTCSFYGCYYFSYPDFFLTRIDASVCVLIAVVFLFFAAKQILRGLFDRQPNAYEGKTTTPMDRDPDDGPNIIWQRHDDFETVTDPDWWIQPGIDA